MVLQLWKSIDTFQGHSTINTWIYKVSLNTLLNKTRSHNKSVPVEPLDIHHHFLSNAKADDNVELLHLTIQSLNDIDKAIVILYLEGYKNKEIAKLLSMTPTNINTRFSRLKSQMKMKFNIQSHEIK